MEQYLGMARINRRGSAKMGAGEGYRRNINGKNETDCTVRSSSAFPDAPQTANKRGGHTIAAPGGGSLAGVPAAAAVADCLATFAAAASPDSRVVSLASKASPSPP